MGLQDQDYRIGNHSTEVRVEEGSQTYSQDKTAREGMDVCLRLASRSRVLQDRCLEVPIGLSLQVQRNAGPC